jgi:hypothetical protein
MEIGAEIRRLGKNDARWNMLDDDTLVSTLIAGRLAPAVPRLLLWKYTVARFMQLFPPGDVEQPASESLPPTRRPRAG